MSAVLPFLPILLALVATLVVVPASLAAKLHRLAPQGMSRGECWGLIVNGGVIGPSVIAPLGKGETKAFRQQAMSYRLTYFGSLVLLWMPAWGLFFILNRVLKP